MEEERLTGWDPYDALLSPVFRLPALRKRWAPRYVSQQVVLRAPLNLRPLLRVPRQLNPVTIGLYLRGLADLAAADLYDRVRLHEEAEVWIPALEGLAADGWHGACWGYPFPWEGRKHRMPCGHPTVVATGIVVDGLHRCWRVTASEHARSLVSASAGFVLRDLRRAAGNDEAWCWSYSPTDGQAVLNATMKGTRLLAQAIDAGLPEQAAADATAAASASARFVAAAQEADGGWPYAVGGDRRSWRDNHHTGYVLECFHAHRELLGGTEFDLAIDRGWEHYRSRFFGADALPRYYDSRRAPLDPTAAGQSLITLATFGDADFAQAVATACIEELGRPDGSFGYRSRRGRAAGPHFMRWSTAWMFAGIARVLAARAPGGQAAEGDLSESPRRGPSRPSAGRRE